MKDRERNKDDDAERPGKTGEDKPSTGTVDDSQGTGQSSGSTTASDGVSELAGEVTTGDEP